MQLHSLAAPPLPDSSMEQAFREFVLNPSFPCVAAKSAVHGGDCQLRFYDELASPPATAALSGDLLEFVEKHGEASSAYSTFAAIFRGPLHLDEREFERLLWTQLRRLNREDSEHFAWDASVSSDPDDPHFAFSFGERAFFIVGLHAASSRQARRFAWPTLIFNFHEQFSRLRAEGKWARMQQTIRARDERLQGSINPMISDFGDSSEARQYSGRAVDADWHAPFTPAPSKCPFHH
jgi:FPC/CPF motif-containing protein YcgG